MKTMIVIVGLLMGGCYLTTQPAQPVESAEPVATTQPAEPATTGQSIAHAVDTVGLPIMEVLAIAGLPLTGLVASIWRNRRQAKLTANIISSVQAGRVTLSRHNAAACEKFDYAVSSIQTNATTKLVRAIKGK